MIILVTDHLVLIWLKAEVFPCIGGSGANTSEDQVSAEGMCLAPLSSVRLAAVKRPWVWYPMVTTLLTWYGTNARRKLIIMRMIIVFALSFTDSCLTVLSFRGHQVANCPYWQDKYVEDVCNREVPQEDVRWQSALLVDKVQRAKLFPGMAKMEIRI